MPKPSTALEEALSRIGLNWDHLFETHPNLLLVALDAAESLSLSGSPERLDYYLIRAASAFERACVGKQSVTLAITAAEEELTMAWEEGIAPALEAGRALLIRDG